MKMDAGVLALQAKIIIQVTSWTNGEEFTCTLVPTATAMLSTDVVMTYGILMNCITLETTRNDEDTTGKKNLQGILQSQEELLEQIPRSNSMFAFHLYKSALVTCFEYRIQV